MLHFLPTGHATDFLLSVHSFSPQNGHQQRPGPQQNPQAGFNFMPQGQTGGLDPSSFAESQPLAKQMAALTAANHARIAQNTSRGAHSSIPTPGGTSSGSYLGAINNNYPSGGGHDLLTSSANGHANFQTPNNGFGLPQTPNSASNSSFLDAPMSQSNPSRPQGMNTQLRLREQGFLNNIATIFAKKGQPLPPGLTGVPTPNYDPSNTIWTAIEIGHEPGYFKLAGKEVNLFKLWGLVTQHGGGQMVC